MNNDYRIDLRKMFVEDISLLVNNVRAHPKHPHSEMPEVSRPIILSFRNSLESDKYLT